MRGAVVGAYLRRGAKEEEIYTGSWKQKLLKRTWFLNAYPLYREKSGTKKGTERRSLPAPWCFYGKKTDLDIVAESWELSTHPDGESVVTTGPYAGMKLSEYVNALGKDCLGTKGNAFEFFPILIKFIDAKQPLSIQVHPDNEYALRVEKEYGKNFGYV